MTRPLNLSRSWKFFAAFLLIALVAFWPSYSSQVRAGTPYTHLHAVTAASWMVLLILQSWAIDARHVQLHRLFGKTSYVIAPLVILSILLLAHERIAGAEGRAFEFQVYVLYIQISLTVLFALSYILAIWNSRSVALHSRFMVCTALALVDPVVVRLLLWLDPTPEWNLQWFTYGLTDAILLCLIWAERANRAGRKVFPAMLLVFVLAQAPALLGFTETDAWQGFARWYASL